MLKENKGIQIRKDTEKRHRKRHKDIKKIYIQEGNMKAEQAGRQE